MTVFTRGEMGRLIDNMISRKFFLMAFSQTSSKIRCRDWEFSSVFCAVE